MVSVQLAGPLLKPLVVNTIDSTSLKPLVDLRSSSLFAVADPTVKPSAAVTLSTSSASLNNRTMYLPRSCQKSGAAEGRPRVLHDLVIPILA